jgi:Zn-dependent alcohol dehydrogenase
MRITAAIQFEASAPLKVEEIELEGPRQGEVMVRLVATGVCHTDIGAAKGNVKLPIVLGHEGAGIIQEVGPGVENLKPGDHVVLTPVAGCGRCRYCLAGEPALCEAFGPFYSNGQIPGGRRLRTLQGDAINHFFLQSSFAEYCTVPSETAVKVREDAPFAPIVALGCGALTGLGSVINIARPKPGSSIVVVGCGSVGLSAVMAARLAGAAIIIAVDLADSKLAVAGTVGATHALNAKSGNVVEQIYDLTGGGADCAVISVNAQQAFDQAFKCLRPGGHLVVNATPYPVTVDAVGLLIGAKNIHGSRQGLGNARADIPRYIDLFMSGRLPLDKLLTGSYPLSAINQAFQAQEKGGAIKPVIQF